MKQHEQLRVEIDLQSGSTVCAAFPVNQESTEREGVSMRIEEQTEDGLQLATLHLNAMPGNSWGFINPGALFNGLAQNNPIRVYVPLEPKPQRMTALYLFSDWWTRPAFVKRYEEIPPRTQVLLMRNRDGFACLVPMVGQQWKATANGGTETELCLTLGCGVGGFVNVDEPLYLLAEGDTVWEAVHRAFTWLARDKGILTREQRRLPEAFRHLGWCSWDAFYTKVDETGLRQKAKELTEKSVPVGWMMIDDGWMSTQGTFLTGFAPDREKFPNGFARMVEDIRQTSSIKTFGVWHALGGYWSGVERDSELARQETDHLTRCVNGSLVPSPEQGADFYRHWYQLLRREGIDLVKVDGQSAVWLYYENTCPVSAAARGMNEALESASVLMDNAIINCMGMAMENVLARPTSAVSRNSNDFFPSEEGSFAEHLLENAYNAIYHDELYYCDWDMFWTSHPDSVKHSLLRAISGGPVYFSDRVGETNPDVLRPLTYLDGTVLMMSRSAKPTEDCVFSDPLQRGVLKLQNTASWGSSTAGGIAVYNLTHRQQEFSFTPRDIPELEDARRYWVYDWFEKKASSIKRGESFHGTMEEQGFGWYVILPERESLSCLGLTEKYAGFTAVESVLETADKTTVVLRETGTVSWLSHRTWTNVTLNGENVAAQVVREGCVATLKLSEQPEKAVLSIEW